MVGSWLYRTAHYIMTFVFQMEFITVGPTLSNIFAFPDLLPLMACLLIFTYFSGNIFGHNLNNLIAVNKDFYGTLYLLKPLKLRILSAFISCTTGHMCESLQSCISSQFQEGILA